MIMNSSNTSGSSSEGYHALTEQLIEPFRDTTIGGSPNTHVLIERADGHIRFLLDDGEALQQEIFAFEECDPEVLVSIFEYVRNVLQGVLIHHLGRADTQEITCIPGAIVGGLRALLEQMHMHVAALIQEHCHEAMAAHEMESLDGLMDLAESPEEDI